MIVMAISDVMTLNFFYMVRDEGSWLDIGTTISHFCIASFFSVFVAGLEFLSEALIAGVEFPSEEADQTTAKAPIQAGKNVSSSSKENGATSRISNGSSPAHKGLERNMAN
jgi:phosphatidylinositol glycan class N